MMWTKRKGNSKENEGPINENYARGLLLTLCGGITISSSYRSVGHISNDEERYEQISEINSIPPSEKNKRTYKDYFTIEPQKGESADKKIIEEILGLKEKSGLKDRIVNDLYTSFPKLSSQVTKSSLRKRDGTLEVTILK